MTRNVLLTTVAAVALMAQSGRDLAAQTGGSWTVINFVAREFAAYHDRVSQPVKRASDEATGFAHETTHIRVEDPAIQRLIAIGRERSALFNALVQRLEESDLVVYVRCEPGLRRGTAARLTFVSATARFRYVLVRVSCLGDRSRQIALVGHELRHAVEVADMPEVVDSRSLQTAYERIGFINRRASVHGVTAFESDQAIEAGERILRELRDGTN